MGDGIWGSMLKVAGPGGKNSSSLDDPWSSGGSDSYSGLDAAAKPQWEKLFNAYSSPTGMAPWQQAGFNQAVTAAGTRFSALNAARGGMNPYTGDQIASSAAQYAAPQFAQLNSQLLNSLMQQRQISTGKSRGPGFNYNNVNSGNSNWWGMWNNIGSSWGGGGRGSGGYHSQSGSGPLPGLE